MGVTEDYLMELKDELEAIKYTITSAKTGKM